MWRNVNVRFQGEEPEKNYTALETSEYICRIVDAAKSIRYPRFRNIGNHRENYQTRPFSWLLYMIYLVRKFFISVKNIHFFFSTKKKKDLAFLLPYLMALQWLLSAHLDPVSDVISKSCMSSKICYTSINSPLSLSLPLSSIIILIKSWQFLQKVNTFKSLWMKQWYKTNQYKSVLIASFFF